MESGGEGQSPLSESVRHVAERTNLHSLVGTLPSRCNARTVRPLRAEQQRKRGAVYPLLARCPAGGLPQAQHHGVYARGSVHDLWVLAKLGVVSHCSVAGTLRLRKRRAKGPRDDDEAMALCCAVSGPRATGGGSVDEARLAR
jgi:hypothetical protein